MSERVRRRRSRELRVPRHDGGLSPASRLRIAADVHRHSTSDDDSGCVLEEYAWVFQVHMYFAALPEEKVPYVNSSGEKWRVRQLRHQLPPQDSDPRYCSRLSTEEEDELRLFERRRKVECLGRGAVDRVPYDDQNRKCATCSEPFDEGEVCVIATRTGTVYHPACFQCAECATLLVDLIYFSHDGKVYCGRHHAEQIKPRCARCDELIFGEECTEAEGRTWHHHHFQCSDCSKELGGQKYMQRNNKPVCLSCFHSEGSPTLQCTSCKGTIPLEHPHISQSDLSWHADRRCFCCSVCAKNLLGRKYSLVNNSLYCGYKTCGGEDELFDDDRIATSSSPSKKVHPEHQRRKYRTVEGRAVAPSLKMPSSPVAPRPPQRAPPPPPPPAENIYETVLPSTAHRHDCRVEWDVEGRERYSRTPSKGRRRDENGYR
ncbi:unnamed protein product [Nippostrongylus brasiliensis]|uniref:Prickle-like protein 4 (inferred by orthology to a human protein) n=1 Tax=Nippostrongylus brasiliensis TaxID=27835 RepID=A0A158R049_NIPBR|nr:unnamed protein product [Nippostrongylus brasiliensis]